MRPLRSAPLALPLLALLGCSDPRPYGGVLALSHLEVGGETRHALHGYFVQMPIDDLRDGLLDGCTLAEEAGACRRLDCAAAAPDATDDAGELRASGGATSVSATVNGELGQYSRTGEGAVFEPGDVVTFEGTGGAVPAFTADVIAPDAPAVTFPSALARTAPLTITWSATTAETMQVTILPTSRGPVVRCVVPASAGTLTVDPSLLDGYETGTSVTLSTSALRTTEVVVGDYALDVSVAQSDLGYAVVD